MDNLSVLKLYFPNGTAEGEREILKQVFIPPTQMTSILSAPLGSPRIIVGNKGVGKTAIIERTFNANREQDIPSVLLRPDDIDLSKIGNANDVATVKKVLFEALVGAVAAQIGTKLKGLLDESTAELHKLAVKKGLKAADRVEKGLTLLSTIAKPLTQIDFNQLSQALSGGESQGRLYEALKQHLSSRTSLFVLLVDDTDQIASPDDLNHLNRIWGLLLAVRKLANDLPNIECLVTLRTEIWMRLQRDEKGQRDQVDHIRPLIVNLRAQNEHMARILDKRIYAAAAHIGHTGSAWEAFFESQEMVLPGSNEKRSWRSFLLKSSRERPRDLIQLVGSLIETAQRRRHVRITSKDAEEAMHAYSEERVTDLAIEVGRDCPDFKEVVRTFADLDFEVSFEELRKHLIKIPSRFGVMIRGKTMRPDDDSSVIPLLGMLYEAGVVNARVADSREPKGFRHINFADEAHLVTKARWNDLQAVKWEVHPAFRTYLLDVGADKAHGGR